MRFAIPPYMYFLDRRRGLDRLSFAEDLIGPFHQRHQIGWRHKPGILAYEIVVADRTGP